MAIAGSNPALLAGQNPAKVSRANRRGIEGGKAGMELITRHEINWTIVAARHAGVGEAGLPQRAGGAGRGEAVGGDLHHGASRRTIPWPTGWPTEPTERARGQC